MAGRDRFFDLRRLLRGPAPLSVQPHPSTPPRCPPCTRRRHACSHSHSRSHRRRPGSPLLSPGRRRQAGRVGSSSMPGGRSRRSSAPRGMPRRGRPPAGTPPPSSGQHRKRSTGLHPQGPWRGQWRLPQQQQAPGHRRRRRCRLLPPWFTPLCSSWRRSRHLRCSSSCCCSSRRWHCSSCRRSSRRTTMPGPGRRAPSWSGTCRLEARGRRCCGWLSASAGEQAGRAGRRLPTAHPLGWHACASPTCAPVSAVFCHHHCSASPVQHAHGCVKSSPAATPFPPGHSPVQREAWLWRARWRAAGQGA